MDSWKYTRERGWVRPKPDWKTDSDEPESELIPEHPTLIEVEALDLGTVIPVHRYLIQTSLGAMWADWILPQPNKSLAMGHLVNTETGEMVFTHVFAEAIAFTDYGEVKTPDAMMDMVEKGVQDFQAGIKEQAEKLAKIRKEGGDASDDGGVSYG